MNKFIFGKSFQIWIEKMPNTFKSCFSLWWITIRNPFPNFGKIIIWSYLSIPEIVICTIFAHCFDSREAAHYTSYIRKWPPSSQLLSHSTKRLMPLLSSKGLSLLLYSVLWKEGFLCWESSLSPVLLHIDVV